MGVLHIAPGYSAGGSLQAALRAAERNEALLKWPDDLSAGPINPGSPEERNAWWGRCDGSLADELTKFWERVEAADERLVVWFGRNSASEYTFFLNWADRLGSRPYDIIDVTLLEFPSAQPGPNDSPTWQAAAASMLNMDNMKMLLGSERRISADEASRARERWSLLRSENAPFRVVGEDGVVSAPVDHFDPLLLEQTGGDWQRVARVIGNTMGRNSTPYHQVGDLMLLDRLVALVEAGLLEVDGDPYEMRTCQIRLK